MTLIEPGLFVDPKILNIFIKLSGDTYKVKERIKQMGYKWNPYIAKWIKKVESIEEIEEEVRKVVKEFWDDNEEVREHYLSLIPSWLRSELWHLVIEYTETRKYDKVKRIAEMLGVPLTEEKTLPIVYAYWEPYLKNASPERILRIIKTMRGE